MVRDSCIGGLIIILEVVHEIASNSVEVENV